MKKNSVVTRNQRKLSFKLNDGRSLVVFDFYSLCMILDVSKIIWFQYSMICVKRMYLIKCRHVSFYMHRIHGLLGKNNLLFIVCWRQKKVLNFIIYARYLFFTWRLISNTPKTHIQGWLRSTHCYCVSEKSSSPVNQYYIFYII